VRTTTTTTTEACHRRIVAARVVRRTTTGRRGLGAMASARAMASGATRAAASRGAFVLFEGADRCGKSTQASRLVTRLNADGVRAELWRYPDRTTAMGKMIDEYLQSKAEMTDGAIHLLFAANRWEKKELMERKLSEGVTLVCDRYSYSGVAFTAAKNAPGLDLEWCRAPEIGLPKPDALLYLELSLEEAAKRGGFGEERYETTDIQRAVKKNFDAMKEDWWDVIDASRDMDDIQNQVVDIAKRTVEKCKAGEPLKYFER
jgi:dTMP kinase